MASDAKATTLKDMERDATGALERSGFGSVESAELPVVFRSKTAADAWHWFENITVRAMAIFRLQTPEIQDRINRGDHRPSAAVCDGWRDLHPLPGDHVRRGQSGLNVAR